MVVDGFRSFHVLVTTLFEDRLALNPGLNLTLVFFFLCSKAFSRIIFSLIFTAPNHQLVDKKN